MILRNMPGLALAILFMFLPMVNCSSSTTGAASAASDTSASSPQVIYPAPLERGDTVAIISPAGPIDRQVVDKAAAVLRSQGFVPVVYPHAYGRRGYFSGTADERYADLEAAFSDPSVKAILCSRGGYGVVHNLDRLMKLPLRENPKWVIGFSDISALHALMSANGIASIHASMAKQMMLGPDDPDNAMLLDILRGKMPSYTFTPSRYNHTGKATGRLVGGNLAVLSALIGTSLDIFEPGTILFIEDVAEPIYKTQRILYQLRLAGVLEHLGGLIVGQFTDYKPDGVYNSMEDMIYDLVKDYDYPVAFGVPVGHVDHNIPLVESSQATLDVQPDRVTLQLSR